MLIIFILEVNNNIKIGEKSMKKSQKKDGISPAQVKQYISNS